MHDLLNKPDYASLAARHNMSVSLAMQLGGTGITSNAVGLREIAFQVFNTILCSIKLPFNRFSLIR